MTRWVVSITMCVCVFMPKTGDSSGEDMIKFGGCPAVMAMAISYKY